MAPFAGDLFASDMDLPVNNDASSHACPENHAENGSGGGGSATHGFRQGKAIRVIFHSYWPPQPGLKVAVEGLAIKDGAV